MKIKFKVLNDENKYILVVIVGGYDENGVIDPYLIRFILKREFDLNVPKDVPDQFYYTK